MNKESLMKKVEKLLSLAGNNPSESEAQAAFIKAQKLIAEYNLDMNELGEEKDEIVMMTCEHPNNNGYRVNLASVLGPNFRCRPIMHGNTVAFIGYKTDVEVCVKVFNYAYKVSRRMGQRVERQARNNGYSTRGVFNSFCLGFCRGIKEVLDEQCRALMIIVPEEVDTELQRRAHGNYSGGTRMRGYSGTAYNDGRAAGRDHMRSRQIEGGNK